MRRLTGLFTMMLLAVVVLAACGADDEGEDATEEATEVVATEVAEEVTEEGTEVVADDATEEATEEGTEVVVAEVTEEATEEMADEGAEIGRNEAGTPIPAGTPIVAATPGAMATPAAEASPVADVIGSPAATPVDEFLATSGAETLSMDGEVVLPGALNEAFVISDDGCVGLGEYSDMQAGRQVVVRDQADTIIGVTTLEASDASDSCSWNFSIDVPQSTFYAVSIPMEFEQIFTQSEIEEAGGQVSLQLQ